MNCRHDCFAVLWCSMASSPNGQPGSLRQIELFSRGQTRREKDESGIQGRDGLLCTIKRCQSSSLVDRAIATPASTPDVLCGRQLSNLIDDAKSGVIWSCCGGGPGFQLGGESLGPDGWQRWNRPTTGVSPSSAGWGLWRFSACRMV